MDDVELGQSDEESKSSGKKSHAQTRSSTTKRTGKNGTQDVESSTPQLVQTFASHEGSVRMIVAKQVRKIDKFQKCG